MSKNNCQLQVDVEDGVLIARIAGELDHHGAVAVRTLIDAEICRHSPKKAVLDLSKLDFMDSSGIGLVMGRYTLMQNMGGEFAVREPNERIARIFSLAGLERMISVEKATVPATVTAPTRRKKSRKGKKNEAKGK